jgi:hypothetical protein
MDTHQESQKVYISNMVIKMTNYPIWYLIELSYLITWKIHEIDDYEDSIVDDAQHFISCFK